MIDVIWATLDGIATLVILAMSLALLFLATIMPSGGIRGPKTDPGEDLPTRKKRKRCNS